MVEHAPVVIFTTDKAGTFTLSEWYGLTMLGLKPGEVVGRSVFDVYAAHPKICEDLRACLNGELIIALVPVNGVTWESMYVPKVDADGIVTGVSGVAWDVTARIQADETSRAFEHSLRHRQKMEMVGTLAGGIAHDFNNIIAPILGYAELALLGLAPDHPVLADVEQIRRAARRARELVEQILVFSRRSDQAKTPVRMRRLVNEALQLVHSMVPANVDVQMDVEVKDDLVVANAVQIHQVVMNIAINAIHAMRNSGGTLHVGLTCTEFERPAASERGLSPGPYLMLTVTDHGEGMDEATRARVFEPFFTTRRASGGSGLGLSVVHGIVHSHGGIVEVKSSPGRGSTFVVYLPAATMAALEQAVEEPAQPTRGHGRVLVVDDEPLIVSLLHRLLETFGFHVTGFTSADLALVHFRREPDAFDAIVTDRAMPRMSGLDLARAVHQIRPSLPIILVTGFLEAEGREEVDPVFAGVLTKPFDAASAVRMVQDSVRRGHV